MLRLDNNPVLPRIWVENPDEVAICSDLHLGTESKIILNERGFDGCPELHTASMQVWKDWNEDIISLGDLFHDYDGYVPAGRIYSLKGNHLEAGETQIQSINWMVEGIELIVPRLSQDAFKIILSHRPYDSTFSRGMFNLCGHCHGTKGLCPQENSFDVGVENAMKLVKRPFFTLSEVLDFIGFRLAD